MIISCGEALIDMVPLAEDPTTFQARAGGCPLNTAVAAARLGAKVAFLGRIGGDFLGDRLVQTLMDNSIDCRYVVRSSQPTTLAFVQHGHDGERYAFYSIGAADRSLVASDLPADLGADVSFLMVGSISLLQEPAASTIVSLVERESARVSVSLDPNVRPSVVSDRKAYLERLERVAAASTVIKTSATDLAWLFPGASEEAAVQRLLSLGPALVVVTRGGMGSVARTRRAEAFAPAPRVSVVDTIGAGDSFHGAMLHALEAADHRTREKIASMDESALLKMLSFASAVAALTCTKRGSDPPTLTEVRYFMDHGSA